MFSFMVPVTLPYSLPVRRKATLSTNASRKKPITAISVLIERLTKDEYDVDDLSDLPNLIEAISLQRTTGPTEAARAIRKKLSVHPASTEISTTNNLN